MPKSGGVESVQAGVTTGESGNVTVGQRHLMAGPGGEASAKLYEGAGGYPFYQRGHYRQDRAPIRKVTRFVAKETIAW